MDPGSDVKGETWLTAPSAPPLALALTLTLPRVARYRRRSTKNVIAIIVRPKSVPMETVAAISVLDLSWLDGVGDEEEKEEDDPGD